MNWMRALKDARTAYMENNFEGCRDFGVPRKSYSDKTANGLTT